MPSKLTPAQRKRLIKEFGHIPTKEELFAKIKASQHKMMDALAGAYQNMPDELELRDDFLNALEKAAQLDSKLNAVIPPPITVTVYYKGALQDITGYISSSIVVSENLPFIMLLKAIFDEYPNLDKQYPPGTLGLLLNNHPPADLEELHEGDQITIEPVALNFPINFFESVFLFNIVLIRIYLPK